MLLFHAEKVISLIQQPILFHFSLHLFCLQAERTIPGATDKSVLHKFESLELPPGLTQVEYIWIDGTDEGIRSKCRTLDFVPKEAKGGFLEF